MLVYKDGITRTIEPREEQKYKDLGYVEVKPAKKEEKGETAQKGNKQAAKKEEKGA